ncbi:uncharacterized protein TA16555 [Theileria annulata]|uniref:Snurportin-1 n=1 Tax=Theileria annulata TaxID=5874 RepID=Q4UIY6_THEAN|nr:uncharacterized protein TA16555 [Theileria annulata]CAI72953.1 hypothetical protein TA16555 [Theileria annulata]|eukprot:XP_953631.1 hypothetical protein TA16555 [Theileria annulata]
MEENKRPRVTSLEDLKLEFVEKRRKKYLRHLEFFSTFTQTHQPTTSNDQYTPLNYENTTLNGDNSPLNDDNIEINNDNVVLNDENDHVNEDIVQLNNVTKLNENITKLGEPLELNQLLRLSGGICEILVFPEFITCSDSLISEEINQIRNSLFFVRPEGSRVLIHINNYTASVHNKQNYIRHVFSTDIKGPTILDCVIPSRLMSELPNFMDKTANNTDVTVVYYIIDILMLNGHILTTSDLECRLFFLDSIFILLNSVFRLDELNSDSKILFKFVKYYQVNFDQLNKTYQSIMNKEFDYETDSIIFVNKNSNYIGGYNPNWLCYKDYNINKYCLCDKVICKVYNKSGNLYTHDNVLIGKSNYGSKHKILSYTIIVYYINIICFSILIMDIEDLKISYKIISHSKWYKSTDTLRKIYVNFINRKPGNDNFNKLLQSLSND